MAITHGTRYLHALIAVTVAAVLTVAFLRSFAGRILMAGDYCTDSRVIKGLFLGAALFVGLSSLLGRIPVRGSRVPGMAAVGAALITLGVVAPFVFHYPPINLANIKRTMADIRTISSALESIATAEGAYPTLDNVRAINERYSLDLPVRDSWGRDFYLRSSTSGYLIVSYGDCGEPEVLDPAQYEQGPTMDPSSDIVFRDGKFLRFSDGSNPLASSPN